MVYVHKVYVCLIEGNLLFFILIPMSLAHHSGSISNQADDQTDFASAAAFPFHLFLVLPMSTPDDPSNNCHCS